MSISAPSQTQQLQRIIQDLDKKGPKSLSYGALCEWIESKDWLDSDWEKWVPQFENISEYSRNILTLDPFEVVLLHWPPGVESAVHLHRGFWGAVVCLKGQLENVTYELKSGHMIVSEVMRANPGGMVPEPDGTIHKICNGSQSESLVTLHFYHPALESLDGLMLYDLNNGDTYECNEEATSASIHLDELSYRAIERNVFSYRAAHEASHVQCNVVPKPGPKEIEQMVQSYYSEQAAIYDAIDEVVVKRNRYTESIDVRIAEELKRATESGSVRNVMHLACGTGRRAVSILEKSGLDYELYGVDLCEEMAAQAESRGLKVRVSSLVDLMIEPDWRDFDAVTLLYAYGHLPSENLRFDLLQTVHQLLREGGSFYFDAFDATDPNEWGPDALKLYHEQRLEAQDYEKGDLFYRRSSGTELAFMHYCTQSGLEDLLKRAGFDYIEMVTIGYDEFAGKESGSGKIFVKATKKA